MRRRRSGFAMLAALWLIVAIAVVVLEFGLDAHERAQLGLDAADRGRGRAAALGALAMTQARLEQALRQAPTSTNANAQALRGADPWLGVDSLYSGTLDIDSVPVAVTANDLGTQLNINNLSQTQLRTFFNYVLRDFGTADKLAQAILDWRDVDTLPLPNGAERDQYIQNEQLAIPSNAPFRELEELLQVQGMTPEIYNQIVPYLTTHGSGLINLNTADTIVMRVLPGMTDQTLTRILAARSNGRRITSVDQLFPQQQQGQQGRGGGQQQQQNPVQQALGGATMLTTYEIELTMIAYVGPQSMPVRLRAIVNRSTGSTTGVSWKQW